MRLTNREAIAWSLVLLAALSLVLQSDLLAIDAASPPKRKRRALHHIAFHTNRSAARAARAAKAAARKAAAADAAAIVITPPMTDYHSHVHAAPVCPPVYVYNASQLDERDLFNVGFGPQLGTEEWLRHSDQHATGSAIIARLLHSKRCPLVTDPARARLFLVPLVFPPLRRATEEEAHKVWDFMPPADEERLWAVCEKIYKTDWSAALTHLTRANAARHVFMPLAYFEVTGFCRGAEPFFEVLVESRRKNAELLAAMPTVLTGIVADEQLLGTFGAMAAKQLFSAPLVSSVHMRESQARPWAPRPPGARPWLMSYGGSTEGHPRAHALREHLVAKCREYGDATCRLVSRYQMDDGNTLLEAFRSKRESIFCLEPPGFGDHRKSQVDALTLGCIPVLFTPSTDASIWPLHWGPFREDSRVLLDLEDVLSGRVGSPRAPEPSLAHSRRQSHLCDRPRLSARGSRPRPRLRTGGRARDAPCHPNRARASHAGGHRQVRRARALRPRRQPRRRARAAAARPG